MVAVATGVLQRNVHLLENIGACETANGYRLLRPVLARCTGAQLLLLEENTRSLQEYDTELWMNLVHKTFPALPVEPPGAIDWRRVYLDRTRERETALQGASERLRSKMARIDEQKRRRTIGELSMSEIPKRKRAHGTKAPPVKSMSILGKARREAIALSHARRTADAYNKGRR